MNERRKQIWVAVVGGLALVALLLLAGNAVASKPVGPPDLYLERAELAAYAAATLDVLPVSGAMGSMFSISGSDFQAGEVVTLTVAGPDNYNRTSQVTVGDEDSLVVFWDSSHQPAGSYEVAASGNAGSIAQASWMVRSGVLCGESDGFDAPSLDSAWSWLREDASHWNLSAQPGALRIQTQAGTLTGTTNDQRNLLLRSAPSGNYRVTAQVEVHADQDYQHAGLYLYQDDDHYVRLSRAQASQAVGQGIYFNVESGTVYTATSTADAATVVYLKLGKQDDVYRGFYSRDGVLWHLVDQREVTGFNPSQVGLSAANGSAPFATEIPADFEWLRVDELCNRVFLPVVLKGYAPVGRLLINEVMPQPAVGGSEWVELLNVGPGPLDLGGYQVTDEDGNVYSIPVALPSLPRGGLILIYLDGQGASADDYDMSDKVAVLHSPSGLVDILEDGGDQVAVYQGTPHGPDTIVAFMAYGLTPGEEAANAAQARLWGRYWLVPRHLGLGLAPSDGGPDLSDYSVGLFPGSRLNIPRRWVLYAPGQTTPGQENPVPAPYFRNPPDGIATTDYQIPFGWSHVAGVVSYRLEVDDDPAFGSPALAVDVAGTTYVPTTPFPDGTFYFRVKTRLDDGRESNWSATGQVTFITVAGAGGASLTSRVELGVTPQLQHKDSLMLCLEGCNRYGQDRWDSAHEDDGDWVVGNGNPARVSLHDDKYCTRASISMITDYFGGHLSQDRISYYQYGGGEPEEDLEHGRGMWPCESVTQGDTTKCAFGWALNDSIPISSRGKPTFDQVRSWIDNNGPILIVENGDAHTVVMDGYDTTGDLAHRIDPWTATGSWVSWTTWWVSEYHVPPVGASARSDEAGFSADSDGDGITDFDEINRFCTDANDPDTDNDAIEDKVEIAAYVFDPSGTWDYREPADWESPPDGFRMECDVDNDGDSFPDGYEDSNHNGIYEPHLYETSNFSDTMHTGSPQLHVQPTTLDFGWTADNRTFEVMNVGGGGLAWQVSLLPTWLSLSLDSHVTGSGMRTQVQATLERRALGTGEYSDVFSIVSEFGTQQVAVRAKKDEDAPYVGSVNPTEPEPMWEAGCAGINTTEVRADVSDFGSHGEGSGIDYVQLVFQEVGGQSRSGLPMEAVGAWYEGTLGPLTRGSYQYWVRAADMAGNVTESEHYGIEVYECDPPQISGLQASPSQLHLAPCNDTRLTVQVNVHDATEVREVWLHHTGLTGSEGWLWLFAMNPVGGDMYETTIGPFHTAGTLSYTVTATDIGGAVAESDVQSVDILACEGPSIGPVGQSVDEIYVYPCQPDQITLFADPITDPSGWVDAYVSLVPRTEDPIITISNPIPMQRRSGTDRWEAMVGPLPETFIGAWEWTVVARNQGGGQSESDISSFDVLACDAEPPRFLDIRADEQYLFLEPCIPNSTTIWTEVEADFPLDHVHLLWNYRLESNWWSMWRVVPMQFRESTGEYGADIGPFDTPGTIDYKIAAVDTAGLNSLSDTHLLGVYECQPDGPDISSIQVDEQTIYPAPCTPDTLHVQVIVTDELGRTVTEVKLRYAQGNATSFMEVPMNLVGENIYEGTISGLIEPGLYRFYIEASNDLGGTSYSSTEGFVVAPCVIPGPTIENVELRETSLFVSPCEPTRTEVRAWVSDPLGVSEVTIHYRPKATASAVWLSAPLELASGGYYEGEFGDLTLGAWMYSVEAGNTEGVASWSPPGILLVHRCQVTGPDITVRVPDEAISARPCRPSRTEVQAQISDEYEIEAVSLVYRLDEGDWQARVMGEDSPGEYTAVLGDFDQSGTVTYLVTARNTLGGWAASDAATLQVNDCHLPTLGAPTESADPIYVSPCDLTGITIEAEITDPYGIAGGWLAYRDTNPARDSWNFVVLQQRPNTDRWGADLGPFYAPAGYVYAIYALNNVGGGAWSTAGTFWVLSCSRPTIGDVTTSETPIYVAPCQPSRLTVSAKISSEQDVSGAWIGYRQADVPGAQWQFVAMSPSEQLAWYEGQIGPFGQAGTLEYVISARSTAGGWTWTEPTQGEVVRCQRPTIEKVSSSETSIYTPPCFPSTTVITAQVSDPLGIAEVKLRYRDRTEEQWTILPMSEAAALGVYEVTFGPFQSSAKKDYRVIATNTAGAWSASPLQTLPVDKCIALHTK